MFNSFQHNEISNDHASQCYKLGTKSTSLPKASFPCFFGRFHSLVNLSENLRRRIEKFLHLPELEENDFKNETRSWIRIENGNFNWGDENTTLKNINLEVESNKLIAIVGSVGSGKSSLIQVLV